jgi:hypothetical protein
MLSYFNTNTEALTCRIREMAAEALGVFFYVYPGIASTASFFTNGTQPAFGSLFQIGWAYVSITGFLILSIPTS